MEFTDKPIEPFGKTLLEMAVPTQLSFKTPLVYRMVKELKDAQCLPWTGSHRAELCFDEAVTNAMTHGNGLDPSKKVRVALCADGDNWGAIFMDEGAGFGPDAVPDPSAEAFLFEEAGRGIMLIESYVDKLVYNPAEKKLMMVRKRQAEPEEAEAEAAVLMDEPAEQKAGETVVVSAADNLVEIEIVASRIDGDNVAEVRDRLTECIEENCRVCLDLSRLEYVSSVGLGTLVAFYKQVRSRNGQLVIAGMQAAVRDILESAHLLKLFQTAPDRDAAIAHLRKSG